MRRVLTMLLSGRSSPAASRPTSGRSLRLKLGLLFGMIAALAVILPASVQAYLQYRDARAGVAAENLVLARMSSALVEEMVTQTHQSLEMLAASPSVVAAARSHDPDTMTALLSAADRSDTELIAINVVGRDGRVWATSQTRRAALGLDLSQRAAVQQALAGLTPRPDSPSVASDGQPVVGLAIPIRDADGSVLGAISGALSLYQLSDALSQIRVGEEGFVDLFSREGMLLAHPDRARLLEPVWHQNENVRRALAGGESVMETTDYDQAPIFSAAVPIPSLGWVIQAQVPVDQAMAPFRTTVVWDIGIAIAISLTALALGIAVAHRWFAPIDQLRSATRRIALGDYAFPTPSVETGDELEGLASDFERMRTMLADRTRRLDALRAVAEEITSETSMSSLLDLIVRRTIELVGADSGVFCFWDSDHRLLIPAVRLGVTELGDETASLPGQGVSGAALLRRTGIVIDDYATSLYRHDALPPTCSIVSAMAEPLFCQDRILGTLAVFHENPERRFTRDDLEMLRLLSGQVIVAIENARHLEHRERQLDRQRALTRLNQLVSSALDLEEVLREISEAASLLMDAPSVRFWIADEEARTIELRAMADHIGSEGVPSRSYAYGEWATGWVAEQRQPLSIPDIAQDDRVQDAESWLARGMTSYYAHPITLEGRLLAVLVLFGSKPFVMAGDDLDLLDSFGAQIAVAIRNASLFAAQAAARAEAEAATRAKSDFLAMMSHEIRTPLNGVIGMNDLLQGTELTEQQRSFVARSTESGELLLRVINDILDYSKIEAGRLDLEATPFDWRATVRSVTQLFLSAASAKGLVLTIALGETGPSVVVGDPARLKQVIVNLIGNAIKFTSGGVIRVTGAVEALDADVARLRFEVSDTGVGIDPEAMAGLFSPFAQADASITRRFGGTGLGLAICRRLVEMMDGEIGVDSKVGAGSTFGFTARLPVAAAGAVPTPIGPSLGSATLASVREARATLRILIVEDSPVNQAVASAMMERLGFQSTIAASGTDALQIAFQHQFAAILMDCHLPGMDGYQATAEIRRREADGARIPIIAMTADALPSTRQRCLDAGMDDYLSKPVSLVALDKMLSSWIDVSRLEPALASPADEVSVDPELPTERSTAGAAEHDGTIDLATITELSDAADGLLEVLIEIFAAEGPENLDTLREALDRDDMPEAVRAVHTLKGGAGTIGATDLATLCREVEQLARDGDQDAVTEHLPTLDRELTRALSALEMFRTSQAA
jgi:signal transduction histidine kinase/CheY-like chemotaxis protein/HAMP domain-containing protein